MKFLPTVVYFSSTEAIDNGKKLFTFTIEWLWIRWEQTGRWKNNTLETVLEQRRKPSP